MGTRIFLIRHGQTDYSRNRRYCGQTDVSLNRFGRMQAECLYNLFKQKTPPIVYLSDLSRARQTARLAFPKRVNPALLAGQDHQSITCQKGGVNLVEDKRLREIDFGLWEGLSSEQITKDYNGRYSKWLKSPHSVSIPGGEKLLSLKKRVKDFLAEVIPKHKNEDIAVISHMGPIKIIIFEALGLDLRSFWTMNQEPAAVSLVEFYARYMVLRYFNATSHLVSLAGKTRKR